MDFLFPDKTDIEGAAALFSMRAVEELLVETNGCFNSHAPFIDLIISFFL